MCRAIFRGSWIAIQLTNKCSFENSRLPYLYVSHNELYIRLRGHLNIYHVHQLEHPMHVEAHFATPHFHVNHFQPQTASISSL